MWIQLAQGAKSSVRLFFCLQMREEETSLLQIHAFMHSLYTHILAKSSQHYVIHDVVLFEQTHCESSMMWFYLSNHAPRKCDFIWAITLWENVILFEQSRSWKRNFWHFSFSPCNVEDTALLVSAPPLANDLVIAQWDWKSFVLCTLQVILIRIWETVGSLIHTFVQLFHVLLYPE